MAKSSNDPKDLLPGGITEAQVSAWKKEHNIEKVYPIKVPTQDGDNPHTVTGYFKKPDLLTLSAVASARDDMARAGNIMIENCFLGGDPEIKNNEEVKMAVIVELGQLFKVRKATVGEL